MTQVNRWSVESAWKSGAKVGGLMVARVSGRMQGAGLPRGADERCGVRECRLHGADTIEGAGCMVLRIRVQVAWC
jgi:hypothetical protein